MDHPIKNLSQNLYQLGFSREPEATGYIIYDEEATHMIMEAEKSPDLLLASWTHRKADGIVPVLRPKT